MSFGFNSAAVAETAARIPKTTAAGTRADNLADGDQQDFFEAFGSLIILPIRQKLVGAESIKNFRRYGVGPILDETGERILNLSINLTPGA
jgi:hypothetical protein